MPHLLFADNFLAGSLLTLLMPVLVLSALAVWYLIEVKRVPTDTPTTATTLPPQEMLAAAEERERENTAPPAAGS